MPSPSWRKTATPPTSPTPATSSAFRTTARSAWATPFTEGEDLKFTGISSFTPDLFRRAPIKNPMEMKQLQKGLQQLAKEGQTQLFKPLASNDLILGAVDALQFEVVAQRLEHEYGVEYHWPAIADA